MAERRALLIGTSRYDDPGLPTLKAPAKETRHLAELLNDPDIGGFAARHVIDERKAVLEREIEELFADRGVDDHVLLYLSGHGFKNADNQLFFAATDTRQNRPYSTAIPAATVQRLLKECPARYKAVILDCCYSGSFSPGAVAKSGSAVDITPLGEGTFVLTATNALDPAFEDERVVFGNTTPYSLFTDALIAALETGAAARPGSDVITADDLYEHLDRELRGPRQDGRVQRPHRLNHGLGEFRVASAKQRRLAVDETTAPPRLADLIDRDDPAAARGLRVPIGQAHRSTARGDDLVRLDLGGADGHVCVVGRIWSGKSTLLRTLVAGLRAGRSPAEVRFVCLDGGGQLADQGGAPDVLDVVAPSDVDGVRRALGSVGALIEARDRLFRSGQLRQASQYRELRRRDKLPPGNHADVFLLVDGWEHFAGEAEAVRRIAGAGLGRGVHVVVTARAWEELPEDLLRLLRGRVELGLDDPAESRFDPELAAGLPKGPGWGLVEGRPFLTAVADIDPTDAEISAVAARLSELGAEPESPDPPELGDLLPAVEPDGLRAPIGVDQHGKAVLLDLRDRLGTHGVVVGAAGASELLRTMVVALLDTHSPERLTFALVDARGSTFRGLEDAPHVVAAVRGRDRATARRLAEVLRGEVLRRQELLVERDRALPVLVVAVAEVAELVADQPDLLETLAACGRVGRELGIHLLLGAHPAERHPVATTPAYVVDLRAADGTALLTTADTEVRFLPARSRDGALSWDHPAAKRIWLPPPSPQEPLNRGVAGADHGTLLIPIGQLDNPLRHLVAPLDLDFRGGGQHLAVVGGPQSGKSTLLRTFVLAAALTHDPHQVRFYGVDLGGGKLAQLLGLPHVGDVAGRANPEHAQRIVDELLDLVAEREAAGEWAGPDTFLLVDGWEAVRVEFEDLADAVAAIAQRGRRVGVHLVLTAGRWQDIRPSLHGQFGAGLELRLVDPVDSQFDRAAAAAVPAGEPGSGINADGHHFTTYLPRVDDVASADGLDQAVRDAVAWVDGQWIGERAPRVRVLPTTVALAEVPAPAAGMPIGLDGKLGPVGWDPDATPHFLVFGEGESGKTNLLRTIVRGVMAARAPKDALVILVDYKRGLIGCVDTDHLLGYVPGSSSLAGVLVDVVASMRKRLPPAELTVDELTNRSWWTGPELFLVVDDYDLVATAVDNPLADLVDLLPHAKDIGLHLVVARRTGGAARAIFDPVLGRLRELDTPGIVLSGSPDEGALLGKAKPTPLPPGRGTLVDRRHGQRLVQVAWTDPAAEHPVTLNPVEEPGAGVAPEVRSADDHPGAEQGA
ncbi:type VII secretion protein EccCb [Actinokineospora sp. G85]|uniref:type VII secretion protein EccCb n=1 Tax=Actinokineospora sp. G85 TaxID=3406626 RepID=UPI003C77F466